jgi:hypothetical protein
MAFGVLTKNTLTRNILPALNTRLKPTSITPLTRPTSRNFATARDDFSALHRIQLEKDALKKEFAQSNLTTQKETELQKKSLQLKMQRVSNN